MWLSTTRLRSLGMRALSTLDNDGLVPATIPAVHTGQRYPADRNTYKYFLADLKKTAAVGVQGSGACNGSNVSMDCSGEDERRQEITSISSGEEQHLEIRLTTDGYDEDAVDFLNNERLPSAAAGKGLAEPA